ncbi:hypothetical protein H6776_01710 [Candidatus Nomurabacteria bacterium]|nr:hypothetical protein [Candidatus Nomurabacteria bacterium]
MLEQHEIGNFWKDVKNKKRVCMYRDCNEPAINSHVLQKNGVLDQVAENDHVIMLQENLYSENLGQAHEFKPVGLNNAYSFKGFCKNHDDQVFKEIEKDTEIVFTPYQQALFAYRSLCNELYRKELVYEMSGKLLREHMMDPFLIAHRDGSSVGIEQMKKFKTILETSLIESDFSTLDLFFSETQHVEVCISTLLNIGDQKIGTFKLPAAVVLNIFPWGSKTIIMMCSLKGRSSRWISRKKSIFETGKASKQIKAINEILTLRAEFWAMSNSLYQTIPKEELDAYLSISFKESLNHNESFSSTITFIS